MKNIYIFTIALLIASACTNQSSNISLENDLINHSESANPTQIFQINPKKDTTIIGRLGTEIIIPSRTLDTTDENIEIRLKEIYDKSEMILNGLSTSSDGYLLESSGMINLLAFSNGKEIKIRDGKHIKLKFRNVAKNTQMRSFIGQLDSMNINWQIDPRNVFDTIFYNESSQVIITLPYGRDSIVNQVRTYQVVGLDTLLLSEKNYGGDYSVEMAVYEYTSDYFAISTSNLGWINCDAFAKEEKLTNLIAVQKDYAKTYLIFEDINSILNSWDYAKNNLTFKNIPVGFRVTIISIKKENDDFFYASESLLIKENNPEIKLKYKKMTLKKVLNQLKKLDDFSIESN